MATQRVSPRLLPVRHLGALRVLAARLPLDQVNWALTGSTSHALQGVPVEPHDIDIQTDAAGARQAAEALSAYVVSPPSLAESETIRSIRGNYRIAGVAVELIGAVQKPADDGSWEIPTDPARHRRIVQIGPLAVPVLSLEYEASAYERIGRSERAELLRRYARELASQRRSS